MVSEELFEPLEYIEATHLAANDLDDKMFAPEIAGSLSLG